MMDKLISENEKALRERAQRVIPGGMYGHQTAKQLWPGGPQFMKRGEGAHVWDTDDRKYIDLMCSFGPIVLGHKHKKVDEAYALQLREADTQNLPSPLIVELAERLVSVIDHAEWAMFMKNGSDATTLALTVARATTGRKKILVAKGAYHGALPWCTPNMSGVAPEERMNLIYYTYNNIQSIDEAVAKAGDDLAAIITSPFLHDAGYDQALVDPAFAQHLRAVCDRTGAMLILDDVRCGFRLAFGSSWEPLGVEPDLSAWSKALGNGYAIAALTGNAKTRDGAASLFATGSFWYSSGSMAASLATLDVLEQEDGVAHMNAIGERLMAGMKDQANGRGLRVNVTGHPTMPYLTFEGEQDYFWTTKFAAACAERGLFVHPQHNWFISTAITDALLEEVLGITDEAFKAVKAQGAS